MVPCTSWAHLETVRVVALGFLIAIASLVACSGSDATEPTPSANEDSGGGDGSPIAPGSDATPSAESGAETGPIEAGPADGSTKPETGALDSGPAEGGALAALTIANPAAVSEGDGSAFITFTLTLSKAPSAVASFDCQTVDQSAGADTDYVPRNDHVVFGPTETVRAIQVGLLPDNADEETETFRLVCANAQNATVIDGDAIGTILDDTAPPTVSIVAAPDANEGTDLIFTVQLSHASAKTVTVTATAADGTAKLANGDYEANTGTISIPPGSTSTMFTVHTLADSKDEADSETVQVELSNPANATLGTANVSAKIVDVDGPPSINVPGPQTKPEGNSGKTAYTFAVTLSAASGRTVSVDYFLSGGAGTNPGTDFDEASGTLTFQPGETQKEVTVYVNGDTIHETFETFLFNLTNPVNALLFGGTSATTAIIENDDAPPYSIYVRRATHTEANGTVGIVVTLSGAPSGTVKVDWSTANGSATAGQDYTATSGTITFTSQFETVNVTLSNDALVEGAETFLINLTNPVGAVLENDQAIVTIEDND